MKYTILKGLKMETALIGCALILCLTVTGQAVEYGVSYDSTGGLGINANSAADFASRLDAAGWDRQFLWGNMAAFEKDWKDETKGGWDDHYADAADLAFFEGHGSSSGIHFVNDCCDDSKCSKDDARWGDLDMEWIAAHSCSVLADTYLSNWAYTVCGDNGAHMMCSHKNSCNARNAGDRWAQLMLAGWTVKGAWFQQHIEKQPSGVTARVIATLATQNDHIWGEGSVASDPSPSDTWYVWTLTK
jgi:hypothetical protein